MAALPTIRPVEQTDFDEWLRLWDGYNSFYGRSGATALPAEVTRTTWERFFDPRGGFTTALRSSRASSSTAWISR